MEIFKGNGERPKEFQRKNKERQRQKIHIMQMTGEDESTNISILDVKNKETEKLF